jgi:antitoxin MazE
MKTSVQRWGNSLALRIPRSFAAETRIDEGTEVELSLKSGALVIRPVVRKKHDLSDLLRRVTPANRHEAIQTGKVEGKEVW